MESQLLNMYQLERVRQIAADCLSQEGDKGLVYELVEEDFLLLERVSRAEFIIEQNLLKFSDAECRDRFASEYFFERDQRQEAFDPIRTALEIRNQQGWRVCEAAGRYLALAHSRTDIFQFAANSIVAESHRTFDVLDVVKSSLAYIEFPSIGGLISLCNAQYEHTKRDLMRGELFSIFYDLYKEKVELFRSIIEAVRDNLKEGSASLYTMSLLRISETKPEETIEYIFHDVKVKNLVLRRNATFVLGRLFLLGRVPAEYLLSSTEYLSEVIVDPIEEIRLAAYIALVEGALVHSPLAEILNSVLERKDQGLLRALALVILQNTQKLEHNLYFDRWIMALSGLSPHAEDALENLDFVLVNLLKNGHIEFVISVLEAWIIHNAGDMPKTKDLINIFGLTFQRLLNEHAMRSRLITSWLIRDEYQMRKAAEAILSELNLHKIHYIAFSQEIVEDLDKDNLILLIRRMLGWVFGEEHLVSLLFSLLSMDSVAKRFLPIFEEVLTKEVGFDFPAVTCERLRVLKVDSENPEIQAMCGRVINYIDDYFAVLKALPQIKELRPSQDLRIKMQKQQSKTMEVHKKAADENSIVRELATFIPLKAGVGSFSFRDGEIGQSSYLQSFEHSIALPRRHVLDAVGYELSQFGYRTSQKGQ